MLMKSRLIALALAMAMTAGSPGAIAQDAELVLKAGLLRQGKDGNWEVYKETAVIPFIPKTVDPAFFWGAVAAFRSGQGFKCRVVIYVPQDDVVNELMEHADGKPRSLMAGPVETRGGHKVISVVERKTSSCGVALRLAEDDVPGAYIVELHIDGEITKRVVFDVQAPMRK